MEKIPQHLKKYIVEQNQKKYTPMDQAVWRFILRQLKNFLKVHAHESYLEGLEKTGITTEQIPLISDISKCIEKFGWRALPVSGFIPPAAFMELQALSILPIASDMRSLDHLQYTPAPDIVHEAAGHAPILIHPEFAGYLKKYALVAKKAIINKEDLDLYEAIRILSDIKENPTSTEAEIKAAEKNLEKVSKSSTQVSEAAELGRMNWWTAEYGLIGDLKSPKIYGAGLLSSVGESQSCLSAEVKKIPLSIECLKYSYDITEKQPQLFVTPSFQHLEVVLEEMAQKMAFRTGGKSGLEKAIQSKVINTVVLDSGLQISGQLSEYCFEDEQIQFLKFNSGTQLSFNDFEISGHGKEYHKTGFSTPLGYLKGFKKCLSNFSSEELSQIGLEIGKSVNLEFQSGFQVSGIYIGRLVQNNKTLIITLKESEAFYRGKQVFEKSWGNFDLALGVNVVSVFAGPADRVSFGELDDFVAARVPEVKYNENQLKRHSLYADIRYLRENGITDETLLNGLSAAFEKIQLLDSSDWLLSIEILELINNYIKTQTNEIASHIEKWKLLAKNVTEYLIFKKNQFPNQARSIEDGLKLASQITI